jgi:hypothetical protein
MEALLRIESNRAADTIRKARQGEGIGNGYLPSGWRRWDFSPLERIDELVNEYINSKDWAAIERIKPFVTPPYWTPPRVRISADAEKAIEQHVEITTQSRNLIAIYTDGSRIGAEAEWKHQQR